MLCTLETGHHCNTDQVEYRSVYAERADAGGHEQDANGLAAERGEVQERRPVVVPVLVLDLAFLVLQVQDGPPLRVVQRRGPIARAQQERGKHGGGDQLEPKPPADGAETESRDRAHDTPTISSSTTFAY